MTKEIEIPLVKATNENLKGYGYLIDSFDKSFKCFFLFFKIHLFFCLIFGCTIVSSWLLVSKKLLW